MLETPENAHWFGFECEGETAANKWTRLDEPSLGGKWFRAGTASPEAMALRAFEIVGETRLRVVWAPKDRRYSLATSPPFSLADVAPCDEPATAAPPAPAQPLAPAPPAAPPAPPTQVAQVEQVPIPDEIVQGPAQYAAPVIPMQFAPPPSGTATDPLTTHVYLHSLVRQDMLSYQQQTLAMAQMMIETERARSRETLKAMELQHLQADRARTEFQRVVLESREPPPQLEQMTQTLAEVKADLAELGHAPEQPDQPEEPDHPNVPPYSDAQVLIATVGQILNSPIGIKLVSMLEGPKEVAHAVGQAAAAVAEA